jgi:nitrate/TMAO reductase-like tetraheme cytochrome c subunit
METKNSRNTIGVLKERLSHMEKIDNIAPFPIYGSDLKEDFKNEILKMENNKKINYDELPVAACKYCKSLHIKNDDAENDHCMSCGSINEIEVYENIHEYLKFKNSDDERK